MSSQLQAMRVRPVSGDRTWSDLSSHCSTLSASSSRPCLSSQRGDSGAVIAIKRHSAAGGMAMTTCRTGRGNTDD